MADSPRSPSAADRNLLFGILALQMDFINRDHLVAAMHAWVLEKGKPLGQILQDHKALAAGDRALLEPLVDRHITQHGGDPEKSLAALGQVSSLEASLVGLDDPELQTSVGHLQSVGASKPEGTVDWRAVGPNYSGPRFRILRPHARDGLGEVFVAEDQELHREVALKQSWRQRPSELRNGY
jgi:eukaryotic-like serine/threonine-protein kinase